ncbi:MAG: endopeptidase La [Methylophilaceae bacterium]|jgi:ATP-dependent Lon protease|nr:endopeptidase La [Methylophilaceae bacterium]NCV27796.1 endopeptidase La [Nitrosomonadales bacterium]NCV37813.1 endopeptidase La [Betaproteobacteria bacterium]NCV53386.1 endopeptidase La [Betaproteobacteria bacterium]NCW62581.1 endopeptidase La [Betaproteobacteria bacterium]
MAQEIINPITPLLPLRDVVVYPQLVIPLFVGRDKSIKAIEKANNGDKQILLVAQKSANKDDPDVKDLFEIGTLATILQMLKLPDGTVKVLVEGIERIQLTKFYDSGEFWSAESKVIKSREVKDKKSIALMRTLYSQFDQYVKLNKKIPPELLTTLSSIEEPGRMADSIAANLNLKLQDKQKLLETINIRERLDLLLSLLEAELDILQVEKRIRGRVKRQMEKSQREYYLNEQVKAIQKELGEQDETAEFDELEKKINTVGMSKEAQDKALGELRKLKMMSPMSAEASVVRTYIETLINLPWSSKTKINSSLKDAETILDADHHGLDKVKERIIEYLAVQQRVDKVKSPILCLVGPPGVGKTSLGQSIAKAVNRKFIRMALGGVRDESEIRGHRKTYIGSMPGKVLQNMTKVAVNNPLFLLDEVDKMGQDFRGDPSSALLEVLDPEQNHTFIDHYAEVEYDLSDVMFVATANTLNIPEPLLDRMEIIRLPGYTEQEKIDIALTHLVPKQLKAHGLKRSELNIAHSAVKSIIQFYTREAGVRRLEQEIAKICRKSVKQLLTKKKLTKLSVTAKNINDFLGIKIYDIGLASKKSQVGQVTGLAWTQVGGELLTIESVIMPGKGKINLTGKLGDVMKESIHAALSVVRSRSKRLHISEEFYEKNDFHIHLPEAATPKDGPSAGIGMTTGIISSLTGIPVRADVAMTGEITLRGEVLPIGGLKEKLLAAHRGGIKKVIIPHLNAKDLIDISQEVLKKVEVIPVKTIDEVLKIALTKDPESLKVSKTRTAKKAVSKNHLEKIDKSIAH